MKLASESRLDYLADCLAFHERRREEVWNQLNGPEIMTKNAYTELLASYNEHGRMVKWFKSKLNQPFRLTRQETYAVMPQLETEDERRQALNRQWRIDNRVATSADFEWLTSVDPEKAKEVREEQTAKFNAMIPNIERRNQILKDLSASSASAKPKTSILRRLWNRIKGEK